MILTDTVAAYFLHIGLHCSVLLLIELSQGIKFQTKFRLRRVYSLLLGLPKSIFFKCCLTYYWHCSIYCFMFCQIIIDFACVIITGTINKCISKPLLICKSTYLKLYMSCLVITKTHCQALYAKAFPLSCINANQFLSLG